MKVWLRMGAMTALLALIAAVNAQSAYDVPPAITVYPNEYPTRVAFFFGAGTPLERFTASPGSWYAIYHLPLYPGQPYELWLTHDGEAARMKVFALDDHPFGKPSVKFELPMRKVESVRSHGRRATYAVALSIPVDARTPGAYLLLEWAPARPRGKPVPVALQVLAVPQNGILGQYESFSPNRELESPLQSNHRGPYEVPVPRGAPMEGPRPGQY